MEETDKPETVTRCCQYDNMLRGESQGKAPPPPQLSRKGEERVQEGFCKIRAKMSSEGAGLRKQGE